jgi:hypothetical protein
LKAAKQLPQALSASDQLKAQVQVAFNSAIDTCGLSEREAYKAALELADAWRNVLKDLEADAAAMRGEPWEP